MSDIVEILKERFVEGYSTYVDVDLGWHPILEDLHNELIKITPDYQIYQIKEKFGGLRFYATPNMEDAPEDYYKLIEEAETLSYKICEECGEPGSIQEYKGWYSTTCGKHDL
jgi:hypothetical protein